MAEEKNEYKLAEVPSQYALVIQDPEGKELSLEQSMVRLLNEVTEIRKLLG